VEAFKVRRRAAFVAAVLAVDGAMHAYWATGSTWPARNARSLSYAVLGADVPFTLPVVLPLAVLLFTVAAAVYGRGRYGRAHRLGWVLHTATLAVAAGLLLRFLAGIGWAFGIGAGGAFYWLNLLLYTPLCLVLGVAAVTVARADGRLSR
jgi:hypothetical protein